jgi:hypothetical protein
MFEISHYILIYSYFKITDYVNSSKTNESYYMYFLNITRVNNFKGPVGFGIRELSTLDNIKFCNNKTNTTTPNDIVSQSPNATFKYSFYMRTFTSGCYYYDKSTSKWSSYGMEIQSDTDLTMAHCQSTHLTDFAGGLVVTPPSINFQYVWANAGFTQNLSLYITVIVVSCVYILAAILA